VTEVTIVTGGAGGIGLATAKVIGRDHHIVICDNKQDRLDAATSELHQLGIQCDSVVCDISNRESVAAVFRLAVSRGRVVSVINAAGISPQMADSGAILKVNAVGTVNVVDAAFEIASEGFVLVCVASMAAYMLPGLLVPTRSYSYALANPDIFTRKVLFLCRLLPKGHYRNGYSYAVSKHFVIWLCKKNAARFGMKSARILSVSPGSFDTEMGRLEERSGSAEMIKKAALKRFGRAEEIAQLIAFCASKNSGYLTGVDILCDGGVIASKT
jgi:NAD(P)-dependent dehydrogenase (short-subunit alcohol dehydrogenase family)